MELPAPKGAGSEEVSGEADGVTLSQCLADGRVPVPDRMSSSEVAAMAQS